MILFKPEHVELILSGRKTQTRRMGKKRWNVGAVHQARTRMMDADSTFARLRIVAVRREMLGMMTEADARAEGYSDLGDYFGAFCRINHVGPASSIGGLPVWVVEFAATPAETPEPPAPSLAGDPE